MIKAVFFDVDGTLVSHTQKKVPDSARLALEQLSTKGIKRVLATGRHMLELALLPLSDIRFDAYITLNGQLCLDGDGRILSENPITGEARQRVLELFNGTQIPVMLVEKDRMYINFINRHVELAQQAISTPLPQLGTYSGNEIYLAIAYIEKGREKALSEQLPGCRITRWNDYAVDIISFSGGKVAGIRDYLHASGIPREDTLAFGDGENDMDMLKYVGTGIAMGNADDDTKACADYIAKSVDDDGILDALRALKVL